MLDVKNINIICVMFLEWIRTMFKNLGQLLNLKTDFYELQTILKGFVSPSETHLKCYEYGTCLWDMTRGHVFSLIFSKEMTREEVALSTLPQCKPMGDILPTVIPATA